MAELDSSSDRVVFLFDENTPLRLARALREELGENAYHVLDVLHPRAPDEVILKYAGERGWCLVGRDHAILRRPHERAVLTTHKVGVFFINQTIVDFCQIVRTIIRHWPEMKRLALTESRPFLFLLRETSVRRLSRRRLGPNER